MNKTHIWNSVCCFFFRCEKTKKLLVNAFLVEWMICFLELSISRAGFGNAMNNNMSFLFIFSLAVVSFLLFSSTLCLSYEGRNPQGKQRFVSIINKNLIEKNNINNERFLMAFFFYYLLFFLNFEYQWKLWLVSEMVWTILMEYSVTGMRIPSTPVAGPWLLVLRIILLPSCEFFLQI